MDVAPSRKANIIVVAAEPSVADMFTDGKAFLQKLASVADLTTQSDKSGIPSTAVAAVFDGGEIYIPLEDLIDVAKELERLAAEREKLDGEIKRVEGKLANQEFVSKAPEKVVNAEREKLEKYRNMHASIDDRINSLTNN